MRKTIQIFLVLVMILTIGSPIKAEDDQKAYQSLKNYNVYLQGHHSSDTAGIEGGLAVQGDSSFGKELQTFTYGSLFHPQSQHVGEDFSQEEKVSLLIGGKVQRINSTAIISMPYQTKNNQIHGRFIASKRSYEESLPAFMNQGTCYLDDGQVEFYEEESIDSFFRHLESEKEHIEEKLHHLSFSLKETEMETLGDMWLDGQLVTYPIYRSALDPKVMVINIPPQMVDEEYETIVHSFGLDLDDDQLKDIDQFIVTSFVMDGTERQHSQKIAFKGNFLYKKNGVVNVLPYEDTQAYASKIVHYFPEAKQVTNFFDAKAYNLFQAPDAHQIDVKSKGVSEDGKTLYHREYLKQYATGNSSNGSAEYGSGSSIVGAMIAPQASLILSGSGVNGFLAARNLHQRNGAGIQHFPNQWLFEDLEESSASIHVFKYYSEKGKEIPLAGAQFKLVKMMDDQAQYLTNTNKWTVNEDDSSTIFESDEKGTLKFEDFDFGSYYLWEIKAPQGFYQDKTSIQEIHINEETSQIQLKWENFKTEESPRSIRIQKKSAENKKALEGAEFILRRPSLDSSRGTYEYLMQFESRKGEIIYRGFVSNILLATRFTTNEEGLIELENLPQSSMEILEVKPPSGYELPEDPVISVSSKGDVDIEVENKKEKKELHRSMVKKIDQHDAQKALANAEFVLSQEGFYYQGGSAIEPSSWTEDLNKAHRYVSDENGVIYINASDELGFEEGDYNLTEVKAPEGYRRLEKDFMIHLPSKKNLVIPNEKWGSISLKKENTKGEPLSGAKFVLMQNGQYYTETEKDLWSNDVKEAKQFVSDEKGFVKIDKLRYGQYQIREIEAPENYALMEEDLEISINEEKQNETYRVVNKKIEAWTPIEARGSVSVLKTNKEGVPLPGARFVLLQNGQYYTGKQDTPWTNSKLEALLIESNENGQFDIHSLAYGKYQLREVKAPEGYQLLTEDVGLTISEETPKVERQLVNKKHLPWSPVEPQGSFAIIKENQEHERLEAVEFILMKDHQYYTGDHDKMWSENREAAQVLKTDRNGYFKVGGLAFGNYRLRETQALEGYQSLEEDLLIQINEDRQDTIYHLFNQKIETSTPGEPLASFELEKVNPEGEALAFAEFILSHEGKYYRGDQDQVWTDKLDEAKRLVTDSKGRIEVDSLPYGDYRLREIKAPEGYQILRETVDFTLDESQTHSVLTVENKKKDPLIPTEPLASFELEKVNPEGEALAFAEFILSHEGKYYRGDQDQVWTDKLDEAKRLVTDSKGRIEVDSLPYGDYRLREIKAPEGYQISRETVDFTLDESQTHSVLTVENKRISYGRIQVHKKDAQTKESLYGASFILKHHQQYYRGDKEAMWTSNRKEAHVFRSNWKGYFEVILPFGEYELLEIEAPKGYELLPESIAIHLDQDLKQLTVENHPIKEDLPATGISNSSLYFLLGLVLLGFLFYLWSYRDK